MRPEFQQAANLLVTCPIRAGTAQCLSQIGLTDGLGVRRMSTLAASFAI